MILEQLFHELEQRFVDLKKDFTLQQAELANSKKLYTESHEECLKLREKVGDFEKGTGDTAKENVMLKHKVEELTSAVQLAKQQETQRLEEIDTLRARVKEQATQLVESQKRESQALKESAAQNNKVGPLECEIERLQNDLQTLSKHAEWQEAQLTEKNNLLKETRNTASSRVNESEKKLNEAQEEVCRLKSQLENVQKALEKSNEALSRERLSYKELETKLILTEEQLTKEFNAQKRLAELYREKAEEAGSRVNTLQAQNTSLREKLAQADARMKEQVEKLRQQTTEKFKKQAAVSLEKVQALEAELKSTKEQQITVSQQVSDISQVAPTAVEPFLLSQGATLKDMYDRVVKAEEALRKETKAKQEMELYMNQIIKDINEKAPLIVGQRMDYERALASHDQVSQRLDIAMRELSKARHRENQAIEVQEKLEKDNKTLTNQVSDLARQVQHLLQSNQRQTKPFTVGVDANATITENLVVFNDIQELQVRNQQLLQVVRQLGNEVESKPKLEHTDPQVEAAMQALDDLKTERDRQEEMIKAIVKQRDMYRVLLAQSEGNPTKELTKIGSSTQKQTTSEQTFDLVTADRELQLEFDDYKREKNQTEKELRETIDKLRQQVTESKLKVVEAEAAARFAKSQYENLISSKQALQDEIGRLRSKQSECQSLILRHENQLATLDTKTDEMDSENRRLKLQLARLESQKEVMEANEKRVEMMNSKLRMESDNQFKLLDSIQRIEAGMEARNEQEKERVIAENERLKQNVVRMETRVKEIEETRDVLTSSIQQEKAKTEALQADLSSLRVSKSELQEKLAAATDKAKAFETQNEHLQAQLRKGLTNAASDQISSLELQLQSTRLDLQASIATQQELVQNVEQYKAIASTNDQALTELSKASEKWKKEHLDTVTALEKQIATLTNELNKAQSSVKESVTDSNVIREEMDTLVSTNQTKEREYQSKIQQYESKLRGVESRENALKMEIETHQAAFVTAQANYERELQLHAVHLSETKELKKAAKEYEKQMKQAQAEMNQVTAQMIMVEKPWKEKIEAQEATLKEFQDKCESLEKQNAILHSQFNSLSEKMSRNDANKGEDDDDDSEQQELHTLVRYLRRENEIVEEKLQILRQQHSRIEAEAMVLRKANDQVKAELRLMKDDTSSSSGNAPDEGKMKGLLDQMTLLRESNALLRDDSEKYKKKSLELETELNKLMESVEPLKKDKILLQGEVKALQDQVESLNQANTRWKDRVNQLTNKYNQVDQEEFEKVKQEKKILEDKVTSMEAEITKLSSEASQAQMANNQLDKLRGFAKKWKSNYEEAKKKIAGLEDQLDKMTKKSKGLEEKTLKLHIELKQTQDQLKAEKALVKTPPVPLSAATKPFVPAATTKPVVAPVVLPTPAAAAAPVVKQPTTPTESPTESPTAPIVADPKVTESKPDEITAVKGVAVSSPVEVATGTPPVVVAETKVETTDEPEVTEDTLRETALKSMLLAKKKLSASPKPASTSTFGTPSSFNSGGSPFGSFSSTSGGFGGGFGSSSFLPTSGTSNLVFGKPVEKLPVPCSPKTNEEEQRRNNRLERFGAAVGSKREAPETTETSPPLKVAKMNQENDKSVDE